MYIKGTCIALLFTTEKNAQMKIGRDIRLFVLAIRRESNLH